jgi:hypothetical protein
LCKKDGRRAQISSKFLYEIHPWFIALASKLCKYSPVPQESNAIAGIIKGIKIMLRNILLLEKINKKKQLHSTFAYKWVNESFHSLPLKCGHNKT